MRAIVLSAGYGTRLWPLTEDRTKPAIPILGKPLVGYVAEYLAGYCWKFPTDDPRHTLWGNSWAHVDDVVNLMKEPRPGDARFNWVQPVSGHASYFALDAFFREKYKISPQQGTMHLSRNMFYLQDNTGLPQRPLAEAFPEEAQ